MLFCASSSAFGLGTVSLAGTVAVQLTSLKLLMTNHSISVSSRDSKFCDLIRQVLRWRRAVTVKALGKPVSRNLKRDIENT